MEVISDVDNWPRYPYMQNSFMTIPRTHVWIDEPGLLIRLKPLDFDGEEDLSSSMSQASRGAYPCFIIWVIRASRPWTSLRGGIASSTRMSTTAGILIDAGHLSSGRGRRRFTSSGHSRPTNDYLSPRSHLALGRQVLSVEECC